MISRAELKENAKQSLKGKYGNAIAISLLYVMISFASGMVLGILGLDSDLMTQIVSILISAIFEFGYLSFFLKISRNEEVEVSELWSKAYMIIPFIIATILISVFTTLWTLLFIIPGIIASLKYSMTYYIMLDNPEMKALDAINESKRIMEGHKLDYFILGLSFLGWIILGAFTFGILYLWLIPYINVTMCNFYNEIKLLN